MSGPEPVSRRAHLDTGLEYRYLEWPSDSDHTVVLVHGFLDMAHGWVAAARSGLAGRYHLIAPDMRGHGDSDRIGAGGYYHFMDYVADLTSLIATTRRQRLSLVGHSMGGSIASYYAGTFPGEVEKLALLEGMGPPEMDTAMPERVRTWLSTWKRAADRGQKIYQTVDDAADRLRAHDPLLGDALARELAEAGTQPCGPGRCFKHDPLHLTRGPYPFRVDLASQFWSAITCPVLVVSGDQSKLRLSEDDADRRLSSLKNHRRATLEGAGHMMQRHQPAALAELLVEFLG